jgi:site-specific recombinase XerD
LHCRNSLLLQNFNCFFLLYSDTFKNGWKRDTPVHSKGLELLADKVPDLLRNSRANNTTKVYLASFQRWSAWAAKYPEVKELPAAPAHVILYITELSQSVGTFASINQFLSALSWAHNVHGLASPVRDSIVAEVVNGIKRKLAGPTTRKVPFTPSNINQFFQVMNSSSLTDVRNTLVIVLAYVAFLRFDEVTHILIQDLSFHEKYIELAIPKAKTDQLRQGESIVIAKANVGNCPVVLLSLYFSLAKINAAKHGNQFLFSRIIFKGKKLQRYQPDKAMSYSNVRELVKSKSEQIGLDASLYSTHSMRSGGGGLQLQQELA